MTPQDQTETNPATPKRDVNAISAITAGRLILNLIGTAVHAGYFAD